MRNLFFALCVGMAVCARAAERINSYVWAEMARDGAALPGELVTQDGRTALRVQNTNETPLQVRLLTVANPSIRSSYYALRGQIKYVDVHGEGFLEMWNVFAPEANNGAEKKFFSRTLGESGEMGKISGTSDWRDFLLPFNSTGATSSPSALEVNLILPGPGVVFLGPMELVQYPGGPPFESVAQSWWTDRTGSLIGGIMGGLFGCMAGLLMWLASKGRARLFVVGAMKAWIAIGAVLLVLSLVAGLMRQPYGVWFPLLLCGVIILGIVPSRLRTLRRSYKEQEFRRMEAADAV